MRKVLAWTVVVLMWTVVVCSAAEPVKRTKAPEMRKGTAVQTMQAEVRNAQFKAEQKAAEKGEAVVSNFWFGK
jgi:hypothetical protein